MPSPNTSTLIRRLVAEHYGVRGMPMRVLLREDEIVAFEADHPEVPPMLWELVNHHVRLIRMWARPDLCVDIVVWCDNTQSYQLVQDIVFRDAYPDAETWHRAVFELVKASSEVYVVTHDD